MKHQKGFSNGSLFIGIIIVAALLIIGIGVQNSSPKVVERTSLEKHCSAQQADRLLKGDYDVFNTAPAKCIPLK